MARYKNADITVQATMEYECDLDKEETLKTITHIQRAR